MQAHKVQRMPSRRRKLQATRRGLAGCHAQLLLPALVDVLPPPGVFETQDLLEGRLLGVANLGRSDRDGAHALAISAPCLDLQGRALSVFEHDLLGTGKPRRYIQHVPPGKLGSPQSPATRGQLILKLWVEGCWCEVLKCLASDLLCSDPC